MLDINLIREKPEVVKAALTSRNMDTGVIDDLLALDKERRSSLTVVETLKAERNAVSKEISQIKDQSQRQEKIDAMRQVGEKIAELDEQVRLVEEKLQNIVSTIPNIPDEKTPPGPFL